MADTRKLCELYEAKKTTTNECDRAELDRLIEERIRWIGSGQGHEP